MRPDPLEASKRVLWPPRLPAEVPAHADPDAEFPAALSPILRRASKPISRGPQVHHLEEAVRLLARGLLVRLERSQALLGDMRHLSAGDSTQGGGQIVHPLALAVER